MSRYYDLAPTPAASSVSGTRCNAHPPEPSYWASTYSSRSRSRSPSHVAPPRSRRPPHDYPDDAVTLETEEDGVERYRSSPKQSRAARAWSADAEADIIKTRAKGQQMNGRVMKSKYGTETAAAVPSRKTPERRRSTLKSLPAPEIRPLYSDRHSTSTRDAVAKRSSLKHSAAAFEEAKRRQEFEREAQRPKRKFAITVAEAKNIVYESWFGLGEVNPVVTVIHGHQEFVTEKVNGALAPEWNETFIVEDAPDSSQIVVVLHDKKLVGKTTIGTHTIHLEDDTISALHDARLARWYPLFDGFDNTVGEIRLCLELASEEVEKRIASKNFRKSAAEKAGKPQPPMLRNLQVTVVQGERLHSFKEAAVFVTIGKEKKHTHTASGPGDPQWNETLRLPVDPPGLLLDMRTHGHGAPESLGTGFVPLDMKLVKALKRGHVDVMVPLTRRGQSVGNVCTKLGAAVENNVITQLTVSAPEGNDLKPIEGESKSDVVLVLLMGAHRQEAPVQRKTLNPKWTETFSFDVERRMLEVRVVDRKDHDSELGEGSLHLSSQVDHDLRVQRLEQWLDLHHRGAPAGRLRLVLKGDYQSADKKGSDSESEEDEYAPKVDQPLEYRWMHKHLKEHGADSLLQKYDSKKLRPIKDALSGSQACLDARPWELRAQVCARLFYLAETGDGAASPARALYNDVISKSTPPARDKRPYRGWLRARHTSPYCQPPQAQWVAHRAVARPVTALLMLGKGTTLVMGTQSGHVYVWDARAGAVLQQLDSCGLPICSLMLVETNMVLGSTDKGAHLWHLPTGHIIVPGPKRLVKRVNESTSHLDLQADSTKLLLDLHYLQTGSHGLASVWDLRTQRDLTQLYLEERHVQVPSECLWAYALWTDPVHKVASQEIVVMNLKKDSEHVIPLRTPIRTLNFITEKQIVCFGNMADVTVYSAQSGALREITLDVEPSPPLFALPISERAVVAAGTDGVAVVVDVHTKKEQNQLVTSLTFGPTYQPLCAVMVPFSKDHASGEQALAFGLASAEGGFVNAFSLVNGDD